MTANYNGKQANNSSYIKNFVSEPLQDSWNEIQYFYQGREEGVLIPSSKYYSNVVVPGNLYVGGKIINPIVPLYSVQEKGVSISQETYDSLMELTPISFTDPLQKIHYGLNPVEVENKFPNLVDKDSSIQYLELIPLLIGQIQRMQKQIDRLLVKEENIQG